MCLKSAFVLFCKKGILKNFVKFTGKYLSLVSIKILIEFNRVMQALKSIKISRL